MHQVKRGFWLSACIMMLLTAAGCFQPAGGGLEATNIAQALPTFTPFPTNTASPLPLPTEIPTDIVIQEVPTMALVEPATEVAMLQDPNLDPFWQTATAAYLLDIGQAQPIDVVPLDVATLDPNLASATALVREATETAAFPMTQTAQAIIGFPTATVPFAPTWTLPGPVPPPPSGADCIYEVQPGDANLYRISLKFGVSWESIAAASGLVNPNLIHVGDKLVIPGCGTTGYVPPPTSVPTYPAGYTPVPPNNQTYIVQPGDTLFALSIQWGTTVQAIATLNQIPNVNLIYIGQTLYIP